MPVPFDYARLKRWPFEDVVTTYGPKDTMLYALALGAGRDPTDERALRYVFERDLVALPTMAVTLGYPGSWMSHPESGIDYRKVVHGENRLTLHQPLPAAGAVVGRTRVTRIVDKGAGRGVVVTAERTIDDRASGARYATIEHITVCRAEGGYSASGQPSDAPAEPLPRVPDREPDAIDDVPTSPDMALLYRLLADPNPLHADPALARAAGFPRPILHGLASYGAAGLAVMRRWTGDDPARLASLHARFVAPVFPGDTMVVESWGAGARVHFRVRVPARESVVIDCGVADIAGPGAPR
jgi:acyl dehydratase